MKRIVSFILFLVFVANILLQGQENVSYQILPYDQKITIDGNPKEKIWKQLSWSSEFGLVKDASKAEKRTRFKLFADRENLYILVEFEGQTLEEVQAKKESQKFDSANYFSFYFAPRPERDDHYCIQIDFNGLIKDFFLPAKAGHGYPYTEFKEDSWDAKAEVAIVAQEKYLYAEVRFPLDPLILEKNIFKAFGFNLVRSASFKKDASDQKVQNEVSCWSKAENRLWDSQTFGLIYGPLQKDTLSFTDTDLKNLDQMTNGMTALLKSLDAYYKATIAYQGLIPEGTEVNGDISNFDHVPIPQYPVKADGYYRFYNALKYQPYKDLGNHIVNKLYRLYQETKDANGKNFILWNNLMDADGKVYSYGSGHKMIYFAPGTVPYNQSKNKFCIKDVLFQEALGQGFLDLSEIKESLDADIRLKLIEMLNGTLEFLHQPYILIKRNEEYFWRIDAFTPYEPKFFEGELDKQDWSYLGQDIILMYLALYHFDAKKAEVFTESIVEFSRFYISGRLRLSERQGAHQPHNIYKLDHRMLSLSKFAKDKNLSQFDFLDTWLMKELPKIYEEIPQIDYSRNGATNRSWSTQAMLEIYRLLGLKKQCLKFWELSFDNNMKRIGIFRGHRILPMNFSSYPLYFDYAKKSFDSKILDENKLKIVFQKMFLIYGNPSLHRNNLKYALDLTPKLKNKPMWGNAPYDSYIEGVLPEGIYDNGSAQAFYSIYGDYSVNAFFKTKEDHSRYEYSYHYYQYTAPFQYHSDRYSYGKAESYCLVSMASDQLSHMVEENGEKVYTIEIETPDLPSGIPIFGHLDITNILYKNFSAEEPTGLKVARVTSEGQSFPFREYEVFEFNDIFKSQQDKAKLVFGLWNVKPNQKIKVEISFVQKNFKQYFTLGKAE